MASDLLRRQRATEATMAKYRHREHDWRDAVTCVHMARFHLRRMGHRPEALPRIRSGVAAARALRARGWASVADMLDAQPGLQRIPPAAMMLGDLAVVASEDGIGAIAVCAGPQKLIGWHELAEGMVVVDVRLDELDGAWRL